MNENALLLVVGGGIALASSLVTAVVQHALLLRADRIRRARDDEERRAQALRSALKKKVEETAEGDGVLRAWASAPSQPHSLETLLAESGIDDLLKESYAGDQHSARK